MKWEREDDKLHILCERLDFNEKIQFVPHVCMLVFPFFSSPDLSTSVWFIFLGVDSADRFSVRARWFFCAIFQRLQFLLLLVSWDSTKSLLWSTFYASRTRFSPCSSVLVSDPFSWLSAPGGNQVPRGFLRLCFSLPVHRSKSIFLSWGRVARDAVPLCVKARRSVPRRFSLGTAGFGFSVPAGRFAAAASLRFHP
jgi:hypothetical protein